MKFLISIAILTCIAIIIIILFQNKGADYYNTIAQQEKLIKEIRNLREENDRLKKEIFLLKNDPFYLEKYARDTYGLAASNEIIFKFEQ